MCLQLIVVVLAALDREVEVVGLEVLGQEVAGPVVSKLVALVLINKKTAST